jgi:outer membrane protein TolC
MNDLQAQLTQAENNFRKGTITFDDYNKALKNRNDEQARIINLKLQQDLTKLEIEKMIGTNLESVVK